MFGLHDLLSTCITSMQAVLDSPSQYGTPAFRGCEIDSLACRYLYRTALSGYQYAVRGLSRAALLLCFHVASLHNHELCVYIYVVRCAVV